MNIIIITPRNNDYLCDTILDGFISLKQEKQEVNFFVTEEYTTSLNLNPFSLKEERIIEIAEKSDAIFFINGKNNTNYKLIYKLNKFEKTIFIDGSEVGKDRRFDINIQKQILDESYRENGRVDLDMLGKCKLYFKREKPYIKGIIPLPFGIESKYNKYYSETIDKDIDFFCVFGQEEYPKTRKLAKEIVRSFCNENGFSFWTDKVNRDDFYKILSRSKVGISIGGGGYDTARFWEILGNNCLLLTERINIYQPNSKRLDYKRIWQFDNLFDFKYQLEKIGNFLTNHYKKESLKEEYIKIMTEHSSKSRVLEILKKLELNID